MPGLPEYTYIFAIGTIFATLDAYMIGANDVANAWASSVSSRTFSLRQACFFAAIFEFLGAVTAGARVGGTIKNGIVPSTIFNDDAGLQMLGFTLALMVSATWLTIATRMSWPVSTTYSIVSAIAGIGIGFGGFDAPEWGWNDTKGLGAIWAGLIIAPSLAAAFAAVTFALVKFVVLRRENSTWWGIVTAPFWFFLVTAVLTMSIIYKGSPQLGLDEMSEGKTAAAIVLTATVITILSVIFWTPYVYGKVVKKDATLRWYHFFMGPLLWRRPAPADVPNAAPVQDYRNYFDAEPTKAEAARENASTAGTSTNGDLEKGSAEDKTGTLTSEKEVPTKSNLAELERPQIEGPWILPRNLYILARYRLPELISHGWKVDVHAMQRGKPGSEDARHMADVLSRAKQYPNETEHLFSFLQIMTACTASFAHGSNDLSNAIGPFSVIYHTWHTGEISGKETDIPVWMLVFGGATLVVGLATYGYNIMAVLGNRITLLSPSRGFSLELGAAITVILASQYGIPVSSTMCATGATIGVSLVNLDVRSTNWRAIGWIYLGWIGTIVIVMLVSACVAAAIGHAPRLPS